MSAELEQEDLAAFGVLDDLAHGGGQEDTAPVEPVAADEALEVLRRLYLESLGLLAYELPPAQPLPETRATLLAQLVGDETQEVSLLRIGSGPAALAPHPPKPPAGAAAEPPRAAIFNPATGAPIAGRAAGAPAVTHRETVARKLRPRSRWPAALAVLFALGAAGLGVWVAILHSEVAYRDAQLRGLESRLTDAGRLAPELAAAQGELTRIEQRFAFVTAPATTVFVLRPPADGSLEPLARGHLFLAADRRHWQLEVRGLKPEPELRDYQLWFIVDGLPVSGGVFDARPGKPALLAGESLPTGTTAIAVTLERKGGTASPSSPILLTAASPVQI